MIWTIVGAVCAAGVAVLVILPRWLRIVQVKGDSMVPTLLHNDRLLIVRRRHGLRRDSLVVFRHGRKTLVKRLVACAGDVVPAVVRDTSLESLSGSVVPAGHVVVLSDSGSGMDSRTIGFVSLADVIGVGVTRLR